MGVLRPHVCLSVCLSVSPMPIAQKRRVLELYGYYRIRTLAGNLMLEVELIDQRDLMATKNGQNVLEAKKTYDVNISKTKHVVTAKRK